MEKNPPEHCSCLVDSLRITSKYMLEGGLILVIDAKLVIGIHNRETWNEQEGILWFVSFLG